MTWASQNRQSPRWSLSFGRTNFRLPQHHNTFLTVPATPRGRVCLIVGGASPYTALWAPWGQVQPIVRGEPPPTPPCGHQGAKFTFFTLAKLHIYPQQLFCNPLATLWAPPGYPQTHGATLGKHIHPLPGSKPTARLQCERG